jgi:hypothetical protein
MACRSCQAENVTEFGAEINIHFPAPAAIRLEELWNEIARTYNVDILCGYSLESLRCEEDSYTFRRICEEHSAVRG